MKLAFLKLKVSAGIGNKELAHVVCITNPFIQHRFGIHDKFEIPETQNNLSKRRNIWSWNLARSSNSEDEGALKS
jgi:hypothetical protein